MSEKWLKRYGGRKGRPLAKEERKPAPSGEDPKADSLFPGSVMSLSLSRRALAIAVTMIIAVIAGGASLWVTAPWADSFLDQTSGGPGIRGEISMARGVPGGPKTRYVDAKRETSKRVITPGESTTINFTLRNIWDTRIEITLPMEATLKEVNSSAGEAIPVALTGIGNSSSSLWSPVKSLPELQSSHLV